MAEDLLDIFPAHFFRQRQSRGSRDERRGQGHASANLRICQPSSVMELQRNGRTFSMNRGDQAAKTWQKRIIKGAKASPPMSTQRTYGAGFGDDQSGPSLAPFLVISDCPIADRSLGVGKIVSHRGHEDTILQAKAAENKGREKHPVVLHLSLFQASLFPMAKSSR
ncbi:MAG: hypothetical protein HY882_00605 [Deltaproteobacteria bacterium]|nr:hypothetical protein [Deltaproteobacteria bacterium]